MRFELPWRSARRIRADVAEEFAFHIEARADELVARGMDVAAARAQAEREFGDARRAAEACAKDDLAVEHGRRRAERFAELRQDLRFGVRLLARRPAFTATAALTLAIGIGATTALFSAVYGVLLKPLPYADQDRLVTVWQRNLTRGAVDRPSPGNFMDLRDQLRTIRPMAAAEPYGMDLTGRGDPQEFEVWRVTEGFFGVLGVRPALGRDFRADEFAAGSDHVVLLSHATFMGAFGADSSILGTTITLDREPYQVIGVLPHDLRFPSQGELWVPRALTEADRARRAQTYYTVIGRLPPGVSSEAVAAELHTTSTQLARDFPRVNGGMELSAVPIADTITGDVRQGLLLLFGAVALVLLIACANVAGLLIARGAERERELAVRVALGAGRGRLVRQLLAESVALASSGGALGLVVASVLLAALRRLAPQGTPRLEDMNIAGWPLAFAASVVLLAALACGLVPAFTASRAAVAGTLRGGQPRQGRSRETMVTGEIAVAVVLLVASGLLLRSFAQILRTDLGFGTERRMVMTMHVWDRLPVPAQRAQFFEDLETRLAALPGVTAAGAASSLPLSQMGSDMDPPFVIMNRPEPLPAEAPTAMLTFVTPGALPALGVPLKAGRMIGEGDRGTSARVALVSETMARRFWPDGNALGARIRGLNDTIVREIVGIVGDTRRLGHADAPVPEIFAPNSQRAFGSMSVIVRTDGDPAALMPAIQRTLWELLPGQTFQLESLEGLLSETLATRRFSLTMLLGFAGAALALALVGIYGLMSVTVAQRTRELGVRIALGAMPQALVSALVRRGMVLALLGLGVGGLVALAATRLLRTMLYEVSPTDPVTFIAAALLALVAAGIAAWLPARRAARVDPLVAMRAD